MNRPKVILDPDTANELVDLLLDEPGDADELLLDDAKQALESGFEHIPGEIQRRVRSGECIALQLEAEEVGAAIVLIEQDQVVAPRALNRLANRLRSRLEKAAKRRNRRRERESASS